MRARRTVLALAVPSIVLIAGLEFMGARVSDLVFIIYGSTTALLPAVVVLLFTRDCSAPHLSFAAIASIVTGLVTGWLYGFLSLSSGARARRIAESLHAFPSYASPQNAASTALVWASVVFLLSWGAEQVWRRLLQRSPAISR